MEMAQITLFIQNYLHIIYKNKTHTKFVISQNAAISLPEFYESFRGNFAAKDWDELSRAETAAAMYLILRPRAPEPIFEAGEFHNSIDKVLFMDMLAAQLEKIETIYYCELRGTEADFMAGEFVFDTVQHM